MITTLITETYGGKIDSESDFQLLSQLVHRLITPAAYEIGHKLVDAEDTSLVVPSGTSLKEFMEWIQKLPEREPPTYLGLPANAEKLLLVGQGMKMITDLKLVDEMLDEGEHMMAEAV